MSRRGIRKFPVVFFCEACGEIWRGRVWLDEGAEVWEPSDECPRCGSTDVLHEDEDDSGVL